MLSARWPFRPVRLGPRRRHHEPRRARGHMRLRRLAGLPPGGATRRVAAGRLVAAAAVAAVLAHSVTPAAPAGAQAGAQAAGPPPAYVPPVDAPIIDPFRPPPGPYGAGNRGLEYDTEPGDVVRASADGTVVFAGAVGGSLHVTLLHGDGVRTSYSFLDTVRVVRGQHVHRGDAVGRAGERLHFGARSGDDYFDPASLFGGGTVAVELLPFEVPPGSSPDGEAMALLELAVADHGGGLGLPALADALAWVRARATSAAVYLEQLDPGMQAWALVHDLGVRLLFPSSCSDGPAPSAPARDRGRIAVTVAGLGSSSDRGSIDELRTADLGYDDGRVVRFSYAGGRSPGSGAAFADLATTSYAPADTQGDLHAAARRLADLVEAVAAADPDATIDLFAHSQGGVVARLAVLELADRGTGLDHLGLVTTLGSPHRGADLATVVEASNTTLTGNLGLDVAESLLGTGISPDAEAVRQLAERSGVIRELAERGVPPNVELVSIAARGDLVVASPNTEVAGATNVTVPVAGWSAHTDLVASDAATTEMARALAGQPPACQGWRDAVADVIAGHGISVIEDLAGTAALTQLP